ncbi:MAG TPA: exodeoxyribonuclease VII large subunit [Caulobacteraceae bacterium]|nr:exodeoxyribonuclease VII large subunit [Caulobacteraceae bacterium]
MTDSLPEIRPPESNAQAYSVSELAFALKRTLETTYGFVRLRGELSKITRHASGHIYLTLKDDRAAIDGVVWKGNVRGLACQPQQGMEVIVTGRITTYPASSKYQIVVETLEPAGVGALLAQLERLKAKLAAEGLFDSARKRPLPPSPAVVGVITSPTGAVIRDILHRIRDRWPCQVVVWPVVVQGEQAAGQVVAAIEGFNALAPGGPIARPDVLIIARGGGSVEDLWAFNDEALARIAAASAIPLISAVGHETDTTLIDFVSDRRAPTPTAAAEMATPVLAELRAAVSGFEGRLLRGLGRLFERQRDRLTGAARGLPRPADVLALASQRFDLVAGRLDAALERNAAVHERHLVRVSARFAPALLERERRLKAERLAEVFARVRPAVDRRLTGAEERLAGLEKLRLSFNPDGPLTRGFARIHHADGVLARHAGELRAGEAVRLVFGDGERGAVVDGTPSAAAKPRKAETRDGRQGDLF